LLSDSKSSTFETCSKVCAKDKKCKAFAIGQGRCSLYDKDLLVTFFCGRMQGANKMQA
jgi:hypothetical protein